MASYVVPKPIGQIPPNNIYPIPTQSNKLDFIQWVKRYGAYTPFFRRSSATIYRFLTIPKGFIFFLETLGATIKTSTTDSTSLGILMKIDSDAESAAILNLDTCNLVTPTAQLLTKDIIFNNLVQLNEDEWIQAEQADIQPFTVTYSGYMLPKESVLQWA